MIIGVHAHPGKVMYGCDPLIPEELIQFMDKCGIEDSISLPLTNPEEEHYYYTIEQAMGDCRKYPDRLMPFANIDSRRGPNNRIFAFYDT